VKRELREMGWDVLTIWECEIANPETLTTILKGYLGDVVR
jgi:G:T-mismatch repair DNA endonuclease (very short patch repair protein)